MQGAERFALAALDADLSFPNAAGTFSCALGAPVNEENAPTLYRMLRRVLVDAAVATDATKNKYRHARPFMLDGQPTCQPSADNALRSSGSYPSGHTSIGWAWAEVLAELAPDRADAVLRRGRAFGESRIVCNVHWASDVVEGRIVGAATVVRLHANADFLADLQKAKAELTDLRLKNLPPQRDCDMENRALSQTPWLTP
jgi:acid phosphatase (class A)